MVKFDREKVAKRLKERKSKGRSSKGKSSRGSSQDKRKKGSRDRKPARKRSDDRPSRKRDKDSKRNSKGRRDFKKTKVICDGRGISCEVPFVPTSNKPMYCDECYGDEDAMSKPVKQSSKKETTVNKLVTISERDLDVLNEKLNKIMKALNIE